MPVKIGSENTSTASEVAQECGVTEETVKRWVRQGSLVGKRMGGKFLISRTSFENFKRQGKAQKADAGNHNLPIFEPPSNSPFTAQPEVARWGNQPPASSDGRSFGARIKDGLFVMAILLAQGTAFLFALEGANLYLAGQSTYDFYGIPVPIGLLFALVTQIAILAILFSLEDKNIFKGFPLYLFLAFISVYSSYVFAWHQTSQPARLEAVKNKAALYFDHAKRQLSAEVSSLSEKVQKVQNKMDLEERHGSGMRAKGQGLVWQTMSSQKALITLKKNEAEANMAQFTGLAESYNEQSQDISDPDKLEALVYDISLQMPAEATTEKTTFAAIFQADRFQALPHQRAWRALFADNPAERKQARFSFVYSGMFEFIAFALAFLRISKPFRLAERLEEVFTKTTLTIAKVHSFQTMQEEVEKATGKYSRDRVERTEMQQQNEHEEKSLGHLDLHVKNNNKAKQIIRRKQ